MKLCGLGTSIIYGDCESNNEISGHCWNAISDENNNLLIVDYSNTVYSYINGEVNDRIPFAAYVSNDQVVNNDGILEVPSYHYEDGKKVSDNESRKYAIGKHLKISEDLSTGFGSR